MQIEITAQQDGMSVKSYLYGMLHLSTRIVKRLKYQSDGQGILVNGQTVSVRHVLRQGEVLSLRLEDSAPSENIVPAGDLPPILYEDADLLVLNKPPFMPSHPTHGHRKDTAANAVAAYYEKQGVPFVFRCGSRLDRDTSGVLPIAKNQQAANCFYRAHRAGAMEKFYLAVLCGVPAPAAGEIALPLARRQDSVMMRTAAQDGAPALTRYRTLLRGEDAGGGVSALVLARPVTGRTHQLRVHFASIGCPILSDSLYGAAHTLIARQALHAAALRFAHPGSGEPLLFRAPLPADLSAVLRACFQKEEAARFFEQSEQGLILRQEVLNL